MLHPPWLHQQNVAVSQLSTMLQKLWAPEQLRHRGKLSNGLTA